MKIAHKVKPMKDWRGCAALYKLSTPLESYKHVIVSAVVAHSGPETFIFGASRNGIVLDWGQLRGSEEGILDHRKALKNAGYKIV